MTVAVRVDERGFVVIAHEGDELYLVGADAEDLRDALTDVLDADDREGKRLLI